MVFNRINVLVGNEEVRSVSGHLERIEFMVQPAQSV